MGDLARGTTLPRAGLTVALRLRLWEGVQASPGLGYGPTPASFCLVFPGLSQPVALENLEDRRRAPDLSDPVSQLYPQATVKANRSDQHWQALKGAGPVPFRAFAFLP